MEQSGPKPKYLGIALMTLAVGAMAVASSIPPKTPMILSPEIVAKAKLAGVEPYTYRSAIAFGVDPKELAKVRATALHIRPDSVTKQEVDYLCKIAQGANNLSPDAFAGLHMVRNTAYHQQVIETAYQAAQSTHEGTVYSSVNLLRQWQDPRWRALALAHQSESGELFKDLVRSAKL